MSKHSQCRIFGLVAFLALAGTSKNLVAQVLYVGNAGDDTVSAYVIDQSSGLLTELLPRVASSGSPTSIAIHPSGLYAYATNFGNGPLGVFAPSLTQFSIDPGTGALTNVGSIPLTPGSSPQEVVIDPSGAFAFVAHQGGNYVSAYSIDPSTGALTPVAGSPFATPQGPSSLVVNPNGRFVYVSAAGTGQIVAFSYDSTGVLTPLPGSPFTARNNLSWMAMDPAGKFLFAVERQDNGVLVYSVDPDSGALTQVGSPVPAGPAVTGVTVTPAGNYLYVATAGNGGVSVFSIDPSGALTRTGSYGAVIGANAAILDPTGQYLYVPGPQANAIAALSIDPTSGALNPLAQQFFSTGAAPQRGASAMLSPPVLPPISATSALNYHSLSPQGMPNSGIAQGSRMAVSGVNIGPAAGASGSTPLQTQLGGVSIQIQSGDVTTSALMVYATNNFVTCVVPSSTPLGPATVTVTYNGRSTAPLPVTIVATSVGLRTLNESGVGPAKAWSAPLDIPLVPDSSILQTPITLSQSVVPGQLVIVQGTGMGATAVDETQGLTDILNVPANVIVGNEVTPVLYEARVEDGSDFIVFQLPADVLQGCYVPVAIQAGGVTSNVVGISVSATGGSCSDAAALSSADIDTAQQAGQLNTNTIVLSHIDFGPFGPSDSASGIFMRYDYQGLLGAFSIGNDGPGVRAGIVMPPLGSCTVSPGAVTNPNNIFNIQSVPAPVQYLNVGSTLNLNTPNGPQQLAAPDYSFRPDDNSIVPGDYKVDNGTGTTSFGPFQAALTLPPMLTWTNQASLSTIDRTQDLTITWTGGNPDTEFAFVVGLSASNQAVTAFFCAVDVSAGQLTVPAWVLSSIPASGTFTNSNQPMMGGAIGLGTGSFTNTGRFTSPGFDFSVFTYEQTAIAIVLYQ